MICGGFVTYKGYSIWVEHCWLDKWTPTPIACAQAIYESGWLNIGKRSESVAA